MAKVYIGKSRIEGQGVIARQDIKKGEVVYIAKGKLTPWIVTSKKQSIAGPNWLGISKNLWLNPRKGNFLEFTNHSCDPNMGLKGKVTFVALRNVKKGEELAFDYSTTEEDLIWKLPFKCACGSKRCRGEIRSIQHLPQTVYKKYLPYIPVYFQRVYRDYNGYNQKAA